MYKGSRSRFFPILVVIIIAAIIIFGLVSLVRMLTKGGDSKTQEATTSLNSELLNTDGNRSVTMDVRGPIVSNEAFRSYEITISPTSRTITTWGGYQHDTTINSQTLSNDTKGYDQFVHALDYAGYTKTRSVDSDNTSGLCANGRVYDFTLAEGANSLDDRWTTNCGVKGSFNGDGAAVRQLFLDQLPKAEEYVNKIGL